jgi:hypothetical protein
VATAGCQCHVGKHFNSQVDHDHRHRHLGVLHVIEYTVLVLTIDAYVGTPPRHNYRYVLHISTFLLDPYVHCERLRTSTSTVEPFGSLFPRVNDFPSTSSTRNSFITDVFLITDILTSSYHLCSSLVTLRLQKFFIHVVNKNSHPIALSI